MKSPCGAPPFRRRGFGSRRGGRRGACPSDPAERSGEGHGATESRRATRESRRPAIRLPRECLQSSRPARAIERRRRPDGCRGPRRSRGFAASRPEPARETRTAPTVRGSTRAPGAQSSEATVSPAACHRPRLSRASESRRRSRAVWRNGRLSDSTAIAGRARPGEASFLGSPRRRDPPPRVRALSAATASAAREPAPVSESGLDGGPPESRSPSGADAWASA